MNSYIVCFLLFLYFAAAAEPNNGNKLGDVLKNHTKSVSYNSTKNQQNDEDNLLKQETHKLLPECGVETSDRNYDDDDSRRSPKRRKNSRRNRDDSNESNNYNRNRGNRYSNFDRNDSRNGNRNRNNRYGNKRYNNENYSDENSSEESEEKNYNQNNRRRFNRTRPSGNIYYPDNNSNGFYNGHQDCNERGYFDGNRHQFSGSVGFPGRQYGSARNVDNLRAKRSNDDSQCVSQCVFGYMELLDDNRVPSETMVIKWLQEHLSNDMKRIRALREARRCFARLSTSDIDDGCEFSQSLSKCLNLELE